jgi:mRNA interferase MazF
VRLVVLSTDAYNDDERTRPLVADIVRRIAGVSSPFLVPLADPDPVGGVVDLTSLRTVNRSGMVSLVAVLTGGTLARIADALAAFTEP